MNQSGQAVGAAMRYWNISPDQLLVVHDDLDLPPGTVRLKQDGGHGGQNGIRDIMRMLGHGKFSRLRIGIGHPGHKNRVVDWVLHSPGAEDAAAMAWAMQRALDVLPLVAGGQSDAAMQRLHTAL